jgi:hypothetical protein
LKDHNGVAALVTRLPTASKARRQAKKATADGVCKEKGNNCASRQKRKNSEEANFLAVVYTII